MEPRIGNMRVWHIPQIPGKPFYIPVKDESNAIEILKLLWDYDEFQLEENIKPDYSSASGLEICEMKSADPEDGVEWVEWYSDDGEDIQEYVESLEDPEY